MSPASLSDEPAQTLTLSRSGWLATILLTLLVFLAALVSRTSMLGLPPIYDELYHLLPAMNLLETGTFAVLDGSYERASVFTRLVAFGFDLAGEQSTAAARFLPSALPGALLVAAMFLWTRLVAGWVAAGVVTVFLLFWPNGIEVSQYVRFYALHGLIFVLAALAIYTAMTADIAAKMQGALLAVAVLLLLFALDLQLMTLVGAAAIGLWVAALYGPGWLRDYTWVRWAVAGGLLFVLLVLASGAFNETLVHLWTTYRWEPWPATNDITFYHRDFRDNYPTFWPLFPFAVLIALRARFVPASFCLALFAITFVVLSFGGLKNIRYLYPTMPFFFVIWGIALSTTATALLRYLRDTAEGALAPIIWPPMRRTVAAAILIVSGLFVVAANAAFIRSIRMIDGSETQYLLDKRRWEWVGVRDMVEPWLEEGAVVITTEEMTTVSWLGDYDLAFNKPRFSEMLYSLGPDTQPFTLDFRTGRPIAGEVEDFRPVVACVPVGLVLSNAGWLGSDNARAFERAVQETDARVVTKTQGGVAMLAWRRSADASQAECPDVLGLQGSGAAERLLSGAHQARIVSSADAER